MPRLTRTKICLQWAVQELLSTATRPCGFYLITIPTLMPWDEVSRRHAKMIHLMNLHVARRKILPFGGVRIFEEGKETKRPHAHWVMSPRMSQKRLQYYADVAGMGHVWLDQRPCTEALAPYLSKYMAKSESLKGRRRWACFGRFTASVKKTT